MNKYLPQFLFVGQRNLEKKKGKYKRINTYLDFFCRTEESREEKR